MAKITTITKTQATQLLQNYPKPIFPAHFRWQALSGGTVNTLYKISDAKKNYYLKIDEVGDLKRLSQEMSLLSMLNRSKSLSSYSLPMALPKSNGAIFTPYQNKFIYLLNEVPGKSIDHKSLQTNHFSQLGQALARLHSIAPCQVSHPHKWNLTTLSKTLAAMQKPLMQKDKLLWAKLKSVLQTLKKLQPKSSANTIIHADAFDDNLHWQKDKLVGILDFEYTGLGSPLYDIAMTLLANAWDGRKITPSFAKAFLQSYQKIRSLHKVKAHDWRHAFAHAAITIVITRLKTFEFGPLQKIKKGHRDYREFLQRYEWAQNADLSGFSGSRNKPATQRNS